MSRQLLLHLALLLFAFFYLPIAKAQGNTAYGYQTLYSNTTGGLNSAFGWSAMYSNTSGHNNVAVGHSALFYNTTGYHNTALGSSALCYNTYGYQNTAVGMYALENNTSGNYNTATGAFALQNNQNASSNTATGFQSLYSNTIGGSNTANGYNALYHNTTGVANTASGKEAMPWNTTGSYNSAFGSAASYLNTISSNNVAFGYSALFSDTSGNNNSAVGYQALYSITKGKQNTALGYLAGNRYNYSNSTFLGSNTTTSKGGLSNVTVVGYGTSATASNQVRIGNTAVKSIGGQVGWTTLSDGRYKTQVQEDVPGLAFINKLRPVSYHLDVEKLDKALQNNNPSSAKEQVEESVEERSAELQQAKVKYTGFVAQEVEKAAKELNYDFSGVDKPQTDEDLYGLRYEAFVVPLVKAVQELGKENDELKKKADKVDELEERISKLEAMVNGKASTTYTSVNNIILEQNAPNPFDHSTSIRYYLPPGFQKAQMFITDKSGKMLKQISLTSGSGNVTIDRSLLSSGTYQYSLIVDGKIVLSKTMVVEK